jgi:hypothetical protein
VRTDAPSRQPQRRDRFVEAFPGALIVIDVSVIGWLAQHYATSSRVLVYGGGVLALVVSAAVTLVSRLAYRRVEQLKDV